jgi:hypothetical protein
VRFRPTSISAASYSPAHTIMAALMLLARAALSTGANAGYMVTECVVKNRRSEDSSVQSTAPRNPLYEKRQLCNYGRNAAAWSAQN